MDLAALFTVAAAALFGYEHCRCGFIAQVYFES